MAFLGHKNGPRLSEILKRNRRELEDLTERTIFPAGAQRPTDIVGDLIAEEERTEQEGVIAWAKFTRGHKPNEFIYQFDCGIQIGAYGVNLHYALTPEEARMLGSDYKWELLAIPFMNSADLDRAIWEDQTGGGEFSGPGVSGL